jgi:glycine cleavage system aminomethyltransferase T
VRRRLVAVVLEHTDRLLYHNEPIWRNGELVGRICSGMFGHTVGAPLGLGYLANGGAVVSSEWIAAGRYEVEVADERVAARVSLRPFYDPSSERVKQ